MIFLIGNKMAKLITNWKPEDKNFWASEGRAVARRNLWLSVPALLLAFAVWQILSVTLTYLPNIGFKYSKEELFTLAGLPALSGATMRIFYSFVVPIFGGRRWTAFSTATLLIPLLGLGFAVQDPNTPLWQMQIWALLCGFGSANFSSSMSNISFFFPKAEKGTALGINAGLGNLGVSVVQFVVPVVVTMGALALGEAQTFTKGAGYSRHINAVFASLARAAGFDVRLVQSASRHGTLKVKNARGWLFMNDNLVAVRLGDQWRIFSPGHYYMPYGLLAYQNELTPGLICDEKKPIFQETEAAPAAKSVEARIGRFTLDEEGTLEGDVEIRMGGHLGAFRKTDWNDDSVEEIDTLYRAEIAANLPSAEISDLKWENLRAPEEPLIARFKLKVPGYAELAGSRLIFVPNVFEHGSQTLFTPEKRTNPIMFRHAWSEQDDIAIVLPEGYMLDGATAPTNMANPETDIVGVRYKLSYQGKQRTLSYKRHFAVGAKGLTILPAQSYEPLKNFFDALHTQDEHKLVIKPKPEPAAAPANP